MHIVAAIITKEKPTSKTISKYMPPYKYGTRVERYIRTTKDEYIKERREFINRRVEKHKKYLKSPFIFRLKNGKKLTNYYKHEFPNIINLDDEQLYEYMTKYQGLKKLSSYGKRQIFCRALDEEGNITSTNNPNAFWDSYTMESIVDYQLKNGDMFKATIPNF